MLVVLCLITPSACYSPLRSFESTHNINNPSHPNPKISSNPNPSPYPANFLPIIDNISPTPNLIFVSPLYKPISPTLHNIDYNVLRPLRDHHRPREEDGKPAPHGARPHPPIQGPRGRRVHQLLRENRGLRVGVGAPVQAADRAEAQAEDAGRCPH